MKINGIGAFVSGGASGLGEATTRALVAEGARVAIADVNDDKANALAEELGDAAIAVHCDVTSEEETQAAVGAAVEAFGSLRLAVGCAGVGWPEKIVSKRGPHQLLPFETVVRVNLIGMFNVLRLTAAAMNENEPDAEGERGAVVMTASVAAFDGQIGQVAYSASKGGIVGMTLPAARDLSNRGIRVCTIAPGLFDTPLLAALPEEARQALGAGVPFPQRLGRPAEYAQLAVSIAENPMLNGETIRLDGALRMPPK
ncbi:MAG TPA: 3-hydroxyacyl-CoA dehydrogenase [Thermoleophilaceae bacterium]|nr:3-hydroxyacyl-CoA dehydrogenase [Thermoleophilaceae bacterium]